MTCRPSRITNSILSPNSCWPRSGTGTPRLATPRPGSCKSLRDQLIANGAPRTVQGSKSASITILALTGDLESSGIQKLHQPVPRAKRKVSLILARPIQLRRVDVGDADLLALPPHGVAVVDTVVPRSGGTNGERGSEQKHGDTLPRTSSFSYLEQMWNRRSHRVGGSYDCSKPIDARRHCVHHHRLFCSCLVGAPKAMSSKRLDSIADYSRHGYALRVDCRRCRRVAVLDPLQIALQCQQRGWSKQMAALEERLRCSRCGSRQTRLGPAFDQQQGARDRL